MQEDEKRVSHPLRYLIRSTSCTSVSWSGLLCAAIPFVQSRRWLWVINIHPQPHWVSPVHRAASRLARGAHVARFFCEECRRLFKDGARRIWP